MIIFMLILATSTVLEGIKNSKPCNTHGRRSWPGLCVPITNCPPLLKMATNDEGTDEEMRFLQLSKCSHDDEVPMVCCARACHTPEGLIGKCMDSSKCKHLRKLTRPDQSIEDFTYIRHSRCNGDTKNSVCCGPKLSGNHQIKCENRRFVIPPNSDTGCCGRDGSQDSTIPGDIAHLEQYPWVVLIEHQMPDNSYGLPCGGTLISSRYVLSAAQCFTGKTYLIGTPLNIRLGEFDLRNDTIDCIGNANEGIHCSKPTVIIPIYKILLHPMYDDRIKKDDIALIKMKRNAPYTRYIRPICMPEMDVTFKTSLIRSSAAGWGYFNKTLKRSPVKLRAILPIVNRDKCEKFYARPITSNQICAGGKRVKDTCKGDLGGPLMYFKKSTKTHVLVGIASVAVDPCGKDNAPRLYTKVFNYKEWIYNNMK